MNIVLNFSVIIQALFDHELCAYLNLHFKHSIMHSLWFILNCDLGLDP